jgi:amino-acid N-acetyltransferase
MNRLTTNEITMSHFDEITLEPAAPADWPAICALLQQSGLPLDGLADHLAHTLVARAGSEIVGCAALEWYGRYALLRSVAVAAGLRGSGLGHRLTQAVLAQARHEEVQAVYLLTETAANFFPRFGFQTVERSQVPPAVCQSVEFTTACPTSALAMELTLNPCEGLEPPQG